MPELDEVWLVDDVPEYRERFKAEQSKHFKVRLFSDPTEVLTALEKMTPAALLCDIYFYEDANKRTEIEDLVQKQAAKIRKDASRLEPEKAQTGIKLIQEIRRSGATFPIYAYTAKGPYLIESEGFQLLQELDIAWIFKDRSSALANKIRLKRDIQRFKDSNSWTKKAWQIALASGAIGAVLGVLLDRLLKHIIPSF